jgi:hypothetical protein
VHADFKIYMRKTLDKQMKKNHAAKQNRQFVRLPVAIIIIIIKYYSLTNCFDVTVLFALSDTI